MEGTIQSTRCATQSTTVRVFFVNARLTVAKQQRKMGNKLATEEVNKISAANDIPPKRVQELCARLASLF